MQEKSRFVKSEVMITLSLLGISLISFALSYIFLPFFQDFFESLIQVEIANIITLLIYTGGAVILMWQLAIRAYFPILKYPVFFCLFGFMFYGTVLNLLSFHVGFSPLSSRWIYICLAMPILYITVYTYIESIYHVRLVTIALLWISMIVILLMTFTDKYGNFPSLNGVIRDRTAAYILGKAKGPVSLATLSSITLNVAFILFLTSKGFSRYILGIVSLISFVGLVGAGGRMGWISTGAGLTISSLLMIVNLGKPLKYWLKICMIVVVCLTFVILYTRFIPQTHFYRRLNSLFLLFSGENTFTDVARKRITLWSEALDVITKYPLGVGFSYFSVPSLSGLSPHNDYLNLILGTGFPGFIFYVIVVFLTLLSVMNDIRGTKNELILPYLVTTPVVVVIYFFSAMTEALSTSNSVAIFLVWFFLALGFTLSKKKIGI